jgi:hypothetical protein
MYFAVFYLLFFVLDIYLVAGCIGMVPMHYLVSGIALFLLLFLSRRLSIFLRNRLPSHFLFFYLGFVVLVFFSDLLIGLSNIFGKIALGNLSFFVKISSTILMNYLIICLFMFRKILFVRRVPLVKWIRVSVIGGIIRFGIHIVFPPPSMEIYANMGVIDLIMLFGWLMMIVVIIQKEINDGCGSVKIPIIH